MTARRFFFLSHKAHLALDPEATEVSGGAELQVALLARALAGRGQEVFIAGADLGQPRQRTLEGVRLGTVGPYHTGGVLDTLRALPRVLAALQRERPAFVLVLGWTAWLALLAWPRRILGYRLVYICGLDTEIDGSFGRTHGWRGRWFEHGVRAADGRYAMSEHQRGLFRRAGLDCGFYRNLIVPQPLPTAAKEVDLLWIARCQPVKRPHLFLDLAAALPAARCLMVAPPEDQALFASVRQRAEQLPNVELRASVPYAAVQQVYDRARMLINTSEAEGFANSFIQAGQGRTAIVSLCAEGDGLVERHGAGAVCGGDFGLLRETTRALLEDPLRLAACQQGARTMVETEFDNAANVQRFLGGLP